jgi:MFS family permease
MRAGIAALVGAYVLSQFYRAFLAVLTPNLAADLGATPADLAAASGLWFLSFAAMQVPVGAALDRVGPRRTAALLLGLAGGGGALLFALAREPAHVQAAMALIGVGCSPVLMAAYVIFARVFPPAAFAGLAGATIGLGSLGNVLSAAPLAALVEAVGWREALGGLAGVTALVALLLWVAVRDPAPVAPAAGAPRGSVLDLLRMPALWPILLMMLAGYGPAASLRGLWAGPYARDLHGADAGVIGWVTLAMGLAMVAGNFAYGAADRVLGTRKWAVWGGNVVALAALLLLAANPGMGLLPAAALLALLGFAGSAFPLIMAHGRAFLPPHLLGRGVTLINMFGIGGAGLMQLASRPVHAGAADPEGAFRALFLFFAAVVAGGLLLYLPSRDRAD